MPALIASRPRKNRWLHAVVVGALAVVAASAHEVTYKGTVVGVYPNRYAASDGVLARLDIEIGNGRKRMTFDITQHTQIWRGLTAVTLASAAIQPHEPVAVTYTDEEPEKGAQEIRLGSLTKNSVELQ